MHSSKNFNDSQGHKRTIGRDKAGTSNEWQRTIKEKVSKKLNRVNICRLQENIKKNEKKFRKEPSQKRHEKVKLVDSPTRGRHALQLHFTEENEQTELMRLVQEKSLGREYDR